MSWSVPYETTGSIARSAQCGNCPASRRRTRAASVSTSPTCIFCAATRSGVPRGEQQLEHRRRVAPDALPGCVALVEVERARVGERLQASFADQRLVDAAEPAAV